jgi:hypothetical protein
MTWQYKDNDDRGLSLPPNRYKDLLAEMVKAFENDHPSRLHKMATGSRCKNCELISRARALLSE